MEAKVIQIQNLSAEDFNASFQNLQNQLEELSEILKKGQSPEFLTRQETADLLKVSLVTLFHWDKKDILKPVRIGTQVRYKREDIKAAMHQAQIQ